MSDDEANSTEESPDAEIEERPSFEGQIFSGSKGEVEQKRSSGSSQKDESDGSSSEAEA